MEPTIVGGMVILIGMISLVTRPDVAIRSAFLLTLLGAGAAINLPAAGGASILAAPLFSCFFFLRTVQIPGGPSRLLNAVSPPSAGMWLAVVVIYGVAAAFFIAPFFYDRLVVFPITRASDGVAASFVRSPLKANSGSLTQSVYAIGDLLVFVCMYTLVSWPQFRKKLLDTLLLLGALHVLISFLDIATYFTGTSFLLDWLRAANYTTWQSSTVAGMKRISGLFPEASMYSIYAMQVSGVLLGIYLAGYKVWLSRALFLLSVLMLVLSTSSTAYVALGICGVLLTFLAVSRSLFFRQHGLIRIVASGAAAAVLIVILAVIFVPDISARYDKLMDQTLVSKMQSDSGRDRLLLNSNAWDNFIDTNGLGVGFGNVRTSSFALILLSNLGALGTAAYFLFLRDVFSSSKAAGRDEDSDDSTLRSAARFGVAGGFITACVSLHVFEIGPLLYMLAALASPRISLLRRRRSQAQQSRAGRAMAPAFNRGMAPENDPRPDRPAGQLERTGSLGALQAPGNRT